MFEELDTVELTHDIKEHDLKEGDIGAIVNVYNNGKAYEVEFVAPNGRTVALLTLISKDIRAYVNKHDEYEYVVGQFNAPISFGTVSSITFTASEDPIWKGIDTVVSKDELNIKTETHGIKADKKELYWTTPTL